MLMLLVIVLTYWSKHITIRMLCYYFNNMGIRQNIFFPVIRLHFSVEHLIYIRLYIQLLINCVLSRSYIYEYTLTVGFEKASKTCIFVFINSPFICRVVILFLQHQYYHADINDSSWHSEFIHNDWNLFTLMCGWPGKREIILLVSCYKCYNCHVHTQWSLTSIHVNKCTYTGCY